MGKSIQTTLNALSLAPFFVYFNLGEAGGAVSVHGQCYPSDSRISHIIIVWACTVWKAQCEMVKGMSSLEENSVPLILVGI